MTGYARVSVVDKFKGLCLFRTTNRENRNDFEFTTVSDAGAVVLPKERKASVGVKASDSTGLKTLSFD